MDNYICDPLNIYDENNVVDFQKYIRVDLEMI